MVSLEEVKRISHLARIHLKDEDLEQTQKKFASLLEHFESLAEVDTQGIAPSFHAAESLELRLDEPEAPIGVELLMLNAPDHFEGCFRIPKVVGGADE